MMSSGLASEQGGLSELEYLDKFQRQLSQINTANTLASIALESLSRTKVLYCDAIGQRLLSRSDAPFLANLRSEDTASAIIVENTDINWIAVLGTTLNIDVDFFCEHMENPTGPSPWKAVFDTSLNRQKRPTYKTRRDFDAEYRSSTGVSWHVDGVFQFKYDHGSPLPDLSLSPNFIFRRRECHNDQMEAATRISYYQINRHIDLFLVDAPMITPIDHRKLQSLLRAKLNFPVSSNRGGLAMPQLSVSGYHSIFEVLAQFFTHSWHFHLLRCRLLSAETIMYFVGASTWAANLRHLDHRIKRISFEDIRRPSIHINDQLHECRQMIVTLRTDVLTARKWMPESVQKELRGIRDGPGGCFFQLIPDTHFNEILAQTETVERFLMDTFPHELYLGS